MSIFKMIMLGGILWVVNRTRGVTHPMNMASLIISLCLLFSGVILKMTYSWFFFLLVLMYLGGVMVVITYMASLAANEKSIFAQNNSWILGLILGGVLIFLDEAIMGGSGIFSESVKFLFEVESWFLLVFCFLMLLLALISVVKLMKLEEGPLVKRL